MNQNKNMFTVGGFIAGVVLGYPVSYFFQPGLIRQKLSIGQYISHIGDILGDKNLSGTAFGTWIGCIIALSAAGWFVGQVLNKPKA